MPAPGAPYTAAEIRQAMALKATGQTWAKVSEVMKRPAGSLMVTCWRHGQGLTRKSEAAEQARRAADAVLHRAVTVEGISSAKVLGDRAGLSLGTTYQRLRRLGLDTRARRIAARAAQKRMPSRNERRLTSLGASA